jgi:hypothetical protein
MSVELCSECDSPLAAHQRYCLICGARAGVCSPQLLALLRRIPQQAEPGERAGAIPEQAPSVADPVARASSLRVPPARVSALLVLGFLGFGVLLGGAAGSRVSDTLAASVAPLKLVLPAQNATSSEAPPAASSEPEVAESEPPPAEEQPTPTPAPTASASTPTTSSKSSEAKGKSEKPPSPTASTKLPAIAHVFVIMLSEQPYAAVFGPESKARYLSRTLERRGTLLVRYDAVAHGGLADELALLSGQGPTAQTAANCPTYDDVVPATPAADGQALGDGCVYPLATKTLADQLRAKRLSSRAYVQGLGEAAGQPSPCAHPQLGQSDPSAAPSASGGPYATFRNPFLYFHSLTDSTACASEDVGVGALRADLASAKRTPSFSYVVPDRCHDGNPTPCTPGAPAGMAPADAFLAQIVPTILASKAYRQSGLLVITVDQAPASGELADSSSCCGQPSYPNLPSAQAGVGRGGGTVGALLLSPFLKGAVTSQAQYNHFSLLRTIEDLFALKHLGYAGLAAVKPIEAALFSAAKQG